MMNYVINLVINGNENHLLNSLSLYVKVMTSSAMTSSTIAINLYADAAKYQAIVENAKKADGIVREKYMKSREGIELLGLPEAELKQKVPSASSLANLKDNSVSSHVMIYFVVSSAIM